jgi:hypothetical protein
MHFMRKIQTAVSPHPLKIGHIFKWAYLLGIVHTTTSWNIYYSSWNTLYILYVCTLLFHFLNYVLLLIYYVFFCWFKILIVAYVPSWVFCLIVLLCVLFVYKCKCVLYYCHRVFVCKCVLYYCHRVAKQLQLTNISYIMSYNIISYIM